MVSMLHGVTLSKKGSSRSYHRGNTGPDALAISCDLLHKYGLAGVTVAAVAEALGVSRAAVARQYPTRDALVRAIAERAIESLGVQLMRASKKLKTAEAVERGTGMGRAYLSWARDNPHEYALVFSTPPPESAPPRSFYEESGQAVPLAFGAGLPQWTGDAAANPAFTVWALLHGLATLLTSGPLADLNNESKDRLIQATLERLSEFTNRS